MVRHFIVVVAATIAQAQVCPQYCKNDASCYENAVAENSNTTETVCICKPCFYGDRCELAIVRCGETHSAGWKVAGALILVVTILVTLGVCVYFWSTELCLDRVRRRTFGKRPDPRVRRTALHPPATTTPAAHRSRDAKMSHGTAVKSAADRTGKTIKEDIPKRQTKKIEPNETLTGRTDIAASSESTQSEDETQTNSSNTTQNATVASTQSSDTPTTTSHLPTGSTSGTTFSAFTTNSTLHESATKSLENAPNVSDDGNSLCREINAIQASSFISATDSKQSSSFVTTNGSLPSESDYKTSTSTDGTTDCNATSGTSDPSAGSTQTGKTSEATSNETTASTGLSCHSEDSAASSSGSCGNDSTPKVATSSVSSRTRLTPNATDP